MLMAHHLVEALRKGNMTTPPLAAGNVRNEETYATVQSEWRREADVIAAAHKFDFGLQLEAIADDAALRDTATEFICAGVFRLPFDNVYYEGSADLESGRLTAGVVASTQAATADEREVTDEYVLVFRPFIHRPDGAWVDTGVLGVVRPNADVDFHTTQQYAFSDETQRGDGVKHLLYAAMRLVLSGTVALQSKDTATERVEAPARLNGRRAKRGKPPLFEHRIVRVAPDLSDVLVSGSHRTRRSPRLHWRRGHVRTLPSGGKVPVSPCLVGRSDYGFVDHDYRYVAKEGNA